VIAHAQHRTIWRIETSQAYDALCVINVLTGDPFYHTYYPRTLDR